jgi:spore coat polysaccharide biosynthesis predicted glycosyltransferase SpsG
MSSPHTLAPTPGSTNPLAVLLVDGGRRTGFGHVGRCLALWEELKGHAVFAVEDMDVIRVLTELGAAVASADTPAPIVVIDRRRPTAAAEVKRLRAAGRRVCLLDDPGTGRTQADLVIDPPTGVDWTPAAGRRLAGFEHVLIRRELRAAGSVQPHADAEVLLAMGGSDPEGLTPALAQALLAAGVHVRSVLGPGYRGPRPPGAVLRDSRAWPTALAQAGLLVGRFGHTLLEAAYLGTPALAVATDERALTEAEDFARHGTAEAIGVHGPRDPARVAQLAAALRARPERLATMATRGRKLVDGLGPARIGAALRELADAR